MDRCGRNSRACPRADNENERMKITKVLIEATGGPEVLRLAEADLPDPAPDEVQVRHTAIGLNYQDIYTRSGLYPAPLPSGLGTEAAGVVEKVGRSVADF